MWRNLPFADAQAEAACAAMNLTAKLGMMRGYGTVKAYSGYSRNSGCGGVCGRPSSTNAAGDVTAGTFRWDNGPQGFGDGSPPGKATQWPSTLNMARPAAISHLGLCKRPLLTPQAHPGSVYRCDKST